MHRGHSPGEDPVWEKRKWQQTHGHLPQAEITHCLKLHNAPPTSSVSAPSCSRPLDPSLDLSSSLPQSSSESCNEVHTQSQLHPLPAPLLNLWGSQEGVTIMPTSAYPTPEPPKESQLYLLHHHLVKPRGISAGISLTHYHTSSQHLSSKPLQLDGVTVVPPTPPLSKQCPPSGNAFVPDPKLTYHD